MKNSPITKIIMFTDIVGYSTLVSNNETLAMSLLDEHNNVLMPLFEKYDGKIIKHTGDGFFVIFDDSNKSVECSLKFQNEIKKRNEIVSIQRKFEIRVGIHKGSVIEKNDDVFGHDVNIASRIEGVSVNGGIAISDEVFKSLNNINICSKDMGFVKMKNIKNPMLLHNVYLSKDAMDSQSKESLLKYQESRGINIVDIEKYRIQNTHSLGILSFEYEEDKDDKYATLLTENIIDDFEKINDIRTASRKNVLSFKGTKILPADLARKLKVNNLLFGTLTYDKNKVNVTIKFYDSIEDKIKFDDSWEFNKEDINFIRFKVLSSIMGYFKMDIPDNIKKNLSRKMTHNTLALEKFSEGNVYRLQPKTLNDFKKAITLYKEACDLDNQFVEAWAQLANSYISLSEFEEAEERLFTALDLAQNLYHDQGVSYVYNIFGILYSRWGKNKKSAVYFQKALDIEIKCDNRLMQSKLLNNISEPLISTNDTDKALLCLNQSKTLKTELEEDIIMFRTTYAQLGNVHKKNGDFSKAIENYLRALNIEKIHDLKIYILQRYTDLGQCYTEIGDFDNASIYLDQVLASGEEYKAHFLLNFAISSLSKGIIEYESGSLDGASDYLKQSIDEFQVLDHTAFMIVAMNKLGFMYFYSNKYEEAKRIFIKSLRYAKRKKDIDIEILRSELALLIIDEKDSKDLIDKLKIYKEDSAYYEHWYLAYLIDDKNITYLDISKKLLKEKAALISDKNNQKSFLENIKLHLILS